MTGGQILTIVQMLIVGHASLSFRVKRFIEKERVGSWGWKKDEKERRKTEKTRS